MGPGAGTCDRVLQRLEVYAALPRTASLAQRYEAVNAVL